MDSVVYIAVTSYYNALSKLGYYRYDAVFSLLLLCFYWEFTLKDYRGLISRADYHEIEKALNCLFGTTCLIPYPDYLKMGKLHIGEMTEMAQRVRNLEDTDVLKAADTEGIKDSDILIVSDEVDNI